MAEVVCAGAGFYDIDVKDNDPGSYKLVAYGTNRSLTVTGKTLSEAVEKLIERVWGL